ncbi:precorrin-3B synthase [Actinomadura formosensis]|uniref:precorrin-3B synthase n=1 Tax=Actinomadura formosensis TaxID=60706 RepID=UPI001A95546A|nr:precorrin-3B synthase [Actinomadura formosensis]
MPNARVPDAPLPNIPAPNARARPDACPGMLRTHDAADGPLARVRVPGGAVSAAQLRTLGGAARELGLDVIELTSRGNLQLRGVRDPAALAGRLEAAGLLPSPSHERVRNIVASPLGGRGTRGVLATDPLVTALDRALCAHPRLAALSGRFLFALDDGTGDMTALDADLTCTPAGLLLAGTLLVPGDGVPGDGVPGDGVPGDGVPAVALLLAAADAFLAVRGDAWRLAEVPGGARLVAERLGGTLTGAPGTHAPPVPHAGIVGQRDGLVALEVVPPLGRLAGTGAEALAEVADEVRVTPWRSVVLRDLRRDEAERIAARLEAAGFAAGAASPWVGVTACTGGPGCAKSRGDVQGEARRWVAGLERAPAVPVHWVGCERRCGTPRGPVVLKMPGEGQE